MTLLPADYKDNLGILDDNELKEIPPWPIFTLIRRFTNGPVMFVYDRSVSAKRPIYIIAFNPETWNQAVELTDGQLYCKKGMDFQEAQQIAQSMQGQFPRSSTDSIPQ